MSQLLVGARADKQRWGCQAPSSANAVRRVEDPEFLLGRGTYVGNLRVERMLQFSARTAV